MALVTVSAAARDLKLNKSTVSRQVKKFVEDGTLKRLPNKQFNLDHYKTLRAEALNPLMARNQGDEPADDGLTGLTEFPQSEEPAAPKGPTLQGVAIHEKAARTQLLQIEVDEKRGRITSVAEVEMAAHDAARLLRDRLVAMTRNAKDELAALTDPRAHQVRHEEILRETLDKIHDELVSTTVDDADQDHEAA